MRLTRTLGSCLAQMREAPWSELIFGEDPYLVLVLFLVVGIALYPLFSDYFPVVLGLLCLAILGRAWLWCRTVTREGAGDSARGDEQGNNP